MQANTQFEVVPYQGSVHSGLDRWAIDDRGASEIRTQVSMFCRHAPHQADYVFPSLNFLVSTALLPLAADWEVLEPSSPALQASAIPSQLPVREQASGASRQVSAIRINFYSEA